MSYDPDNIFARILRGEIPCQKVYEDEHTLAFMDIMPQSDGHTLVVPKAEGENIFDIPAEALAAAARTTQRVARAVHKAFEPPGMMITQLNGATAGQSVFHLHFHIIPRYESQSMRVHANRMADPELLAGHAERIRACLD